jgi:hypothetical protein
VEALGGLLDLLWPQPATGLACRTKPKTRQPAVANAASEFEADRR